MEQNFQVLQPLGYRNCNTFLVVLEELPKTKYLYKDLRCFRQPQMADNLQIR